jgi:hypothetical protein
MAAEVKDLRGAVSVFTEILPNATGDWIIEE